MEISVMHRIDACLIFARALHYEISANQLPQHRQILAIHFADAIELLAFRRLENLRHLAKARVVHDKSKRRKAEMPLADVRMPIDTRAERSLRVVDVNRDNLLDAEYAIEFVHRLPIASLSADVITGREKMAGIEAHGKTPAICHELVDAREMLEAVPETVALARGDFQRDTDMVARRFRENIVQRGGDPLHTRFFATAHVAAGMEHDERQIERLRPLQFVRQSAFRLLVKTRIHCAEIDEIAAVSKDRLELRLPAKQAESLDFPGSKRLGFPLHVVLGENLQRGAACGDRAFYRLVHAACDRHVRAQEGKCHRGLSETFDSGTES